MFSKSLAIGALAAGCVAAAAGGAYVAVRHNAATEPAAIAAPAPVAENATAVTPADTLKPVAETEALVTTPAAAPKSDVPASTAAAEMRDPLKPAAEKRSRPAARTQRSAAAGAQKTPAATRAQSSSSSAAATPAASRETREPVAEAPATAGSPSVVSPRSDVQPQAPVEVVPAAPQLEQLVVPGSSVIGLRVETPLSTERARVEDRVDARVTRDVMVDGRVAIPSGARAIGSVILVERGGKMKDRARLGVRFHTLVLADGAELPVNTEAIYREGDSPSGESARKIGGAAVGGAILGALIGGKKGAVVGGATGAAGGTAVVMAGDRNAATLPTGTVVTIRLAAPVGVEVEKR